jgi:hypothetical protein
MSFSNYRNKCLFILVALNLLLSVGAATTQSGGQVAVFTGRIAIDIMSLQTRQSMKEAK